jgi:hypothetical protein
VGHNSRECTPPYLSTGISNLLQPAQAEVVLGHISTYLASWLLTTCGAVGAQNSNRIYIPYFDESTEI